MHLKPSFWPKLNITTPFLSWTLSQKYTSYFMLSCWNNISDSSFQFCVITHSLLGLLAQLVEHCTGIAEVMGSNPIQAWIFFRPYFHYCWSSVHYCEDCFCSNIWLSYIHSCLLKVYNTKTTSFKFSPHFLLWRHLFAFSFIVQWRHETLV